MIIRSIVTALGILGLSMTCAHAVPLPEQSQLSIIGYGRAGDSGPVSNAQSLLFVAQDGTLSGQSGYVVGYGAGYGAFDGFSCISQCGVIRNIPNLSTGAGSIADFLTLFNGSAQVVFDLDTIAYIYRGDADSLAFSANGTIQTDGYDKTTARLLFTTQAGGATSYSATLVAADTTGSGSSPGGASSVPEPASLFVLGAVLVATGLVRGRRSTSA